MDQTGLQAPQALDKIRPNQKFGADDIKKTARQIRQEAAEARLRAAANEDADDAEITLSALAYVDTFRRPLCTFDTACV